MKSACAWLLLAAFALGARAHADDAALAVVDACRAKLDAHDVGIERIAKRCPELLPALDKAPWRSLLPPEMRERREELSAESLRALAGLVRAAEVPATPKSAPDPAKLAPALDALGAQGHEGVTRWERFKRWLKGKFEARDKEDRESNWREDLMRKLNTSEGVAEVITYVGYGLVALLVAWVVWMELRAAGLFGGTRRGAAAAAGAAAWRRRLALADVAAAPLAERPGMLLQLLGEALTRAHRLPASAGLTAGAIARRAELDDAADRVELEDVAHTADAVRYAPAAPPDEALERSVADAKALLARVVRLVPGRD